MPRRLLRRFQIDTESLLVMLMLAGLVMFGVGLFWHLHWLRFVGCVLVAGYLGLVVLAVSLVLVHTTLDRRKKTGRRDRPPED